MKRPSLPHLKKKLWQVFASYIKERDNWTCVTCGKRAQKQGMGAGHYIAKAACGNPYYFGETNVHAQCTDCNLRKEGNRPAYRKFIISKYGSTELRNIEMNYHKPEKWDRAKYEEKIAYYVDKLNTLSGEVLY